MLQRIFTANKALMLSAFLHFFVLLFLILSYEVRAPLFVVSNNDSKVVNAIALTDSPLIAPPSKTLEETPLLKPAEETPAPPPPPEPEAAAQKAEPLPPVAPSTEKKLAIDHPKKEPKPKPQKKLVKKDLSKQLLADLEDEMQKQAKAKKKIKTKFSQVLKKQSEKALEKLMKEQSMSAGAHQRSQHMDGIIDKFKALIIQAIGQQWVVPTHVDKKLACELMIRLAPGGQVLDVQIRKSSGDLALDSSARAAVFKASPLPVPADIYSFEPFREFVLKVKPENVLETQDGNKGFYIS